MAPEDLQHELDQDPFQPVRIVTTDGKFYDITERNLPMVMITKRCVFIGFLVPEDDPCFDRYDMVSLLHVIRTEPVT